MLTLPRPIVPAQQRPRLRFGQYNDETGRIAFASAKASRARVVCEPHQVLAHLADVAAAEGTVHIELPNGRKVPGRLGFPQLDSMQLPFWSPEGFRLPSVKGGRASLHYRAASLAFELETAIRPRWEGLLWQLTIPATLDAVAVRLASRHPLAGWFFDYRDSARGGGFGRVEDVSTTGLSVVTPEDRSTPTVGQTLTGALVSPAGGRIPVRATVRRADPATEKHVRLGCSFEHIGFQNVVRVATLVRRLLRGEEVTAA